MRLRPRRSGLRLPGYHSCGESLAPRWRRQPRIEAANGDKSRSDRCHEHGAGVQQLGIELKTFALTGEGAEQIDARGMVEQQI
jgi:hypothetical protein